jgi:hypothetical protein
VAHGAVGDLVCLDVVGVSASDGTHEEESPSNIEAAFKHSTRHFHVFTSRYLKTFRFAFHPQFLPSSPCDPRVNESVERSPIGLTAESRALTMAASSSARSPLRPLRSLFFLLLTVASFTSVASPCDSNDNALDQFDVVVSTREPLGLRLSERLEILEFTVDAEGRARAVEASGLAEVGDRLLAVNDECVAGMQGGLRAAVEVLQRAQRPMTLRFQSNDGRRLIRGSQGGGSTPSAGGSEASSTEAKEAFDYVVRILQVDDAARSSMC